MFGKQQRRIPFIYSPEQIRLLVAAAGQLCPPLRAATFQALLGLLSVSGMRVGEALRLSRRDVDLTDGVIRVRHPKFDRERLVPLHPSSTEALRRYIARRDRLCPNPGTEMFFISDTGSALRYEFVRLTFVTVLETAGFPTTAGSRPRIHDLRHAMVVNTLIDWQRDGVDVAAGLQVLSTYLGHVSPASTHWYISAVPELMHLAAACLDRRSGGRS